MAVTESDFFSRKLLDASICLRKQNTQTRPKTNQDHLKLVAASVYLPKDDPRKPRGDDAHFICAAEQTIGVADGVGGWTQKGIDAGQYARDLMANCAIAVRNEPRGAVNPKRVLCEGYANTGVAGASTACIITLSGKILNAANVGDSGFMIIRDGKAIYQSPVQQRSFNCPYQLGIHADNPSVADEFRVSVEIGDAIVAGTDGLFDNMHAAEIEEVLRPINTNIGTNQKEMARRIANLALYNSFDRYSETPFSRKSKKAGHPHRGGKIDDITVIVAYIHP